jgi:hypothetical protein
MDCVLTDEVIAALHPVYVHAFDPLRTRAAARHMLSAQEFAAEMKDPRIDKYVVWNSDEVPVGLTTLTRDLSAVPWVSREYYTARYPDAAAAGLLFYLGYILVDQGCRRSKAMIMMTSAVNHRLSQAHGVLGFDMCDYNDAIGIGRHARKLLAASDQIERLDAQSYYGADFRGVIVDSYPSGQARGEGWQGNARE